MIIQHYLGSNLHPAMEGAFPRGPLRLPNYIRHRVFLKNYIAPT